MRVSERGLELFAPVTSSETLRPAVLGGRVRLFDTWFVALSYQHKQFLPRANAGKSDLAGGGKYSAWFATIHLNLAKAF